jgi:hypothetical protein
MNPRITAGTTVGRNGKFILFNVAKLFRNDLSMSVRP